MKTSLKKQILILAFALIASLTPFAASARGLVPCGGYSNDQGTQQEPPCTVQDAFSLIAKVTNWLIAVAGIYAVFQIVNAGFWMVVTMGNEENITKWKNSLTEAVVGFVLVMMAFILINTAVNYILLDGADNCLKVDLKNPYSYFATTCSSFTQ